MIFLQFLVLAALLSLVLIAVPVASLFIADHNVIAGRQTDSVSTMSMSMKNTETDTENIFNSHYDAGHPAHGNSFALASYYASHMVMQSAPRRVRIWGYASQSDVGKTVTVMLLSSDVNHHQPYSSNYSSSVTWSSEMGCAIWQVQLAPVAAGGPYKLQVHLAQYHPLLVDDILFGDVWLCSGQSNMQFPVSNMFNASDELAIAHLFTNVRLFHVAMISSSKPLYDLPGIALNWTLPSNATVAPFSAVCWLFGCHMSLLTGRPQGLIETCWGGTPVEAWSSADALRQCGIHPGRLGSDYLVGISGKSEVDPPHDGTVLWNSMIHPFLPMTINGAIWYQGEANVDAPDTYNCTFPMMISDWRKKFHMASNGETSSAFPFGFVQLAPSDNAGWTLTKGTTDIRWHQTADVGRVPNNKLVNVFMAVAMDLPDPNSPYSGIHPRDKTTVGQRLALAGWAVAYDKQHVMYQGPFPTVIIQAATALNVTYNMNIEVRSHSGFEVCCDPMGCAMSGTNWMPAPMTPSSNTTVTLSLKYCSGQSVTDLRYAWRQNPCQYKRCDVYSTINDLPAPPFFRSAPFA